eukprot:8252443-Pyramimonas_sp.AAC.1
MSVLLLCFPMMAPWKLKPRLSSPTTTADQASSLGFFGFWSRPCRDGSLHLFEVVVVGGDEACSQLSR